MSRGLDYTTPLALGSSRTDPSVRPPYRSKDPLFLRWLGIAERAELAERLIQLKAAIGRAPNEDVKQKLKDALFDVDLTLLSRVPPRQRRAA